MERIGKFEIVEKIGTGGFGAVYKGFDPFIKRHVAVKTCTAGDEDIRTRFFQEAEIAGNLHHRNVTTVYDFGVYEDLPYLVQEYLSGEDLDRKIKRQEAIAFADKLHYLRQTARGLAYAHRKGVVHRDVKPGNVRVLENGTVKIMDFGIAKLMAQETQLTRTGMTVGTAAYLAPEQIRGEAIDRRTDVFSFGVLAYELLTYKRPFEGEQISAVLYQILHHEPPPITDVWPDCPPAVREVIEHCLRKEPGERYPDCGALLDALETAERDGHAPAPRPATEPAAGEEPTTAPLPAPGTAPAGLARDETGETGETGVEPPLSDLELEPGADKTVRMDDALTLPMPAAAPAPGRTRAAKEKRGARRWPKLLAIAALLTALIGGAYAYREELAGWLPASRDSGTENGTEDGTENGTGDGATVTPPVTPPGTTADTGEGEGKGAGDLDATAGLDGVSGSGDEAMPTAGGETGAEGGVDAGAEAGVEAGAEAGVEAEPLPPAPGTVVVPAGWEPTVEVAVDGGAAVALAATRSFELPPGRHTLRFRIALERYADQRELTVDVAPGQRRTVRIPFAPPGSLVVSALIGHPQGVVRLDGEVVDRTPLTVTGLAPGTHELEIRPLDDDPAAAIRQPVTVASGAQTRVTFDLDAGGPATVVAPGG